MSDDFYNLVGTATRCWRWEYGLGQAAWRCLTCRTFAFGDLRVNIPQMIQDCTEDAHCGARQYVEEFPF